VLAQFSAAKVDGIMAGIPASQIEAFLRATGQQGYDKPIGVAMSTTNFTILGKLPPAATKNLILNSAFHRTGVPLYDQIIKAQTDKGIPAGNDEAINAYLAVELFKNVAQGKPDIDRKGVIDAANALPPFDFGGLTGTIDYSKDQTFLGGAFKRLTPTVHYYKYAGGTKLEPAVQGDPAFDLFKAPS
jgi:ABC-type branched-subunit amino acid transport system substrate-binding protein